MMTLARAIGAVMAGTVASGVLGGLVGYGVGALAPSFVYWIWNPTGAPNQTFRSTEFGVIPSDLRGLRIETVLVNDRDDPGNLLIWPCIGR